MAPQLRSHQLTRLISCCCASTEASRHQDDKGDSKF
ncbi:unnamed protein product, partial [Musa acuminata subsp. burmannicoides]